MLENDSEGSKMYEMNSRVFWVPSQIECILFILISLPLCCVCIVSKLKVRVLRIKEKDCKIHNY